MKFFINATQREASGHENYIEFQRTNTTKEFWDENSLYMSYECLEKTKFNSFIYFCAFTDILLDGDTISGKEWAEHFRRLKTRIDMCQLLVKATDGRHADNNML